MTGATATVAAVASRAEVPPTGGDGPATTDPPRLRLAVRVAWVVLGLQLVAMLVWSAHLYGRWGLTWDFAIRYQAWWGIAHGNLDPYVSVAHRYFWQDHFELINWVLAPLSWVWPGPLWTLWIQDLMVWAGELGALYLVLDAVRRPRWSDRVPGWLAVGLVTVLLVANPWIYDSISFDFHYQSVGAACFAMLACREMVRGRVRLLVLWVVLCLACGDIAGTYLAAVGLGGILAGRAYRRRGAMILVTGIGWFVASSVAGGGQGSGLAGHYGYLLPRDASGQQRSGIAGLLIGFATHPVAVLQHLWASRTALWAYASSSGGLGVFSALAVLPVLILVESGAGEGSSLRSVAYENFGIFLFVAPLTVLVLAWVADGLAGRRARAVLDRRGLRWMATPVLPVVVALVLVANSLVWAAVWIPEIPVNWVRTSAGAAAALERGARLIPSDAEVIGSQGVVGRLCGRTWCYSISADGTQTFPLHGDTYVVVAPYDGIESSSVGTELGILSDTAGPLGGHLVFAQDNVWVFRLPTSTARSVTFTATPTEPAWAARTATGTRVLTGPESTWRLTRSGSGTGYALYGAEWVVGPGTYRATVTMASSGPVSVEVWDSSAGVLLGRQQLTAVDAPRAVQSVVRVTEQRPRRPFSGWGPFSFQPRPGGTTDRIEVRVWAPGTGSLTLYSVEMQSIRSR